MAIPRFLAHAKADIHLEAEAADTRVRTFVAQYYAETGIKLRPRQDFQVVSSANNGKRGLEGRVYFNATAGQVAQLRELGFRVQGPRSKGYRSSEYAYRVDKNSLFWDLVRAGHRL